MTDDAAICVVQRLIDRDRLPGPVDEAVWAIRRHLPAIATAEHAADTLARAAIARHHHREANHGARRSRPSLSARALVDPPTPKTKRAPAT